MDNYPSRMRASRGFPRRSMTLATSESKVIRLSHFLNRNWRVPLSASFHVPPNVLDGFAASGADGHTLADILPHLKSLSMQSDEGKHRQKGALSD